MSKKSGVSEDPMVQQEPVCAAHLPPGRRPGLGVSGTQDSYAGLPALEPPGLQGLASPRSHSFPARGPDLCPSCLSRMQAFLFLVRLVGLLSLTSRFLATSALQEGLPER